MWKRPKLCCVLFADPLVSTVFTVIESPATSARPNSQGSWVERTRLQIVVFNEVQHSVWLNMATVCAMPHHTFIARCGLGRVDDVAFGILPYPTRIISFRFGQIHSAQVRHGCLPPTTSQILSRRRWYVRERHVTKSTTIANDLLLCLFIRSSGQCDNIICSGFFVLMTRA